MFRDTTAPHSKSNLENLKEALKGDWKLEKMSRYVFPVLVMDDDEEERNVDVEGTIFMLKESNGQLILKTIYKLCTYGTRNSQIVKENEN